MEQTRKSRAHFASVMTVPALSFVVTLYLFSSVYPQVFQQNSFLILTATASIGLIGWYVLTATGRSELLVAPGGALMAEGALSIGGIYIIVTCGVISIILCAAMAYIFFLIHRRSKGRQCSGDTAPEVVWPKLKS